MKSAFVFKLSFYLCFFFQNHCGIVVEGLPGPDSPDGGGRGEGGLLPASCGGDLAALVQPPPQVPHRSLSMLTDLPLQLA